MAEVSTPIFDTDADAPEEKDREVDPSTGDLTPIVINAGGPSTPIFDTDDVSGDSDNTQSVSTPIFDSDEDPTTSVTPDSGASDVEAPEPVISTDVDETTNVFGQGPSIDSSIPLVKPDTKVDPTHIDVPITHEERTNRYVNNEIQEMKDAASNFAGVFTQTFEEQDKANKSVVKYIKEEGLEDSTWIYEGIEGAPDGLKYIAQDTLLGISELMNMTGSGLAAATTKFYQGYKENFPEAYNTMLDVWGDKFMYGGDKAEPEEVQRSLDWMVGATLEFLGITPMLAYAFDMPLTKAAAARGEVDNLLRQANMAEKARKRFAKDRAKKIKEMQGMPDTSNYKAPKIDAGKARLAARERSIEAAKAAKRAVTTPKGTVVRKEILTQWGDELGTDVLNKDGSVNYDAIKEAGRRYMKSLGTQSDKFVGQHDSLLSTLISNEGKFDAFVAVTQELSEQFPEYFKRSGKKKKPIMHSALDAISGERGANKEALDEILNRYGMTESEYFASSMASLSDSASMMAKYRWAVRKIGKGEDELETEAKAIAKQGFWWNSFLRGENVRRQLMVSKIGTAARNMFSAGTIMPYNNMVNIIDNLIVAGQKGGAKGVGKELVDFKRMWKTATGNLGYMFNSPHRVKDFNNYILNHPALADQEHILHHTLNEMRTSLRKGDAPEDLGIFKRQVDKVLTSAEGLAQDLNVFNRGQEQIVRDSVFLDELERLSKNEYGVDIVKIIEEGGLQDLMGGKYTPEGSKAFEELIADSVDRARKVTFGASPDSRWLRDIANVISRNGFTTIVEFPRFLASSLEFLGNATMGGVPTATKMVARRIDSVVDKAVDIRHRNNSEAARALKDTIYGRDKDGRIKPMTPEERRKVSQNIAGIAALSATVAAMKGEGGSSKPYEFETELGTVDTRANFPIAQTRWVANLINIANEQGIDEAATYAANNSRDMLQLFLGSEFRVGGAGKMLDMFHAAAFSADASKSLTSGKVVGTFVGDWLSTFLIPLNQMGDFIRATQLHDQPYKRKEQVIDVESPMLNAMQDSFKKQIQSPISEEGKAPSFSMRKGETARRFPALRTLLGISVTTNENQLGKFLGTLNIDPFSVSTRGMHEGVRDYTNRKVATALEDSIPVWQDLAVEWAEEYESSDDTIRATQTVDRFVKNKMRLEVDKVVKAIRTKIPQVVSRLDNPEEIDEEMTIFITALKDFTSASPNARVEARTLFMEERGREPNMNNNEDLATVAGIAKELSK